MFSQSLLLFFFFPNFYSILFIFVAIPLYLPWHRSLPVVFDDLIKQDCACSIASNMEDHTGSHIVNKLNLLISHFSCHLSSTSHWLPHLTGFFNLPRTLPPPPFPLSVSSPLTLSFADPQMNLSHFLTQRHLVTSSSDFLSFRSLFHALPPKGFLWPFFTDLMMVSVVTA